MTAKLVSSRSKPHTTYKLADGTRLPGATTIVGLRAKQALYSWNNRMGLQGIDTSKYVDELAGVGTLAHKMVLDHLNKEKSVDLTEYSPKEISLAENSFLSFLEWAKNKEIIPILLETPLVSESMKYGGTPDIFANVNGKPELIEIKTGGIWPEHFIQLSAYANLLSENLANATIERYRVLSIPRAETEAFAEQSKESVQVEFKIFKDLLDIYYLEKELKS